MPRFIFSFALLALLTTAASGGKYNQVLNIGDEAPAWKELPGVDDETHSLGDLADQKVVVVAFTCNSCPYATDVEDRLVALQKDYADRGVSLVAINVNKVREDLPPAMKAKAEKKGFNFPYLFDQSQQIAREYGAKYTPEFFVLNRDRQVVYMGSLDDSPNGEDVEKQYVRRAIDAALEGERPEVTETVPIGCRVRYERNLRGRSR